jgi:riboflavin kinase / FMN adenylyltransferase
MRAYRTGALRLPGSIVVIGAFDGVHLGHQKVIGGAVGASRSLDVPAVVYTFDPPPKALFSGAKVLTDIREKLGRLSLLGPGYTIVASFDRDYSKRPPEDFVDELMFLNPIQVWVGPTSDLAPNVEATSRCSRGAFKYGWSMRCGAAAARSSRAPEFAI